MRLSSLRWVNRGQQEADYRLLRLAIMSFNCLCRGPTGDLYVYLNVQEDPDISREGQDLFSRINISYVEAILGTVVTVSGRSFKQRHSASSLVLTCRHLV
jgi:DnaJ-class molecular chaperone